jgi:hypothetical protein
MITAEELDALKSNLLESKETGLNTFRKETTIHPFIVHLTFPEEFEDNGDEDESFNCDIDIEIDEDFFMFMTLPMIRHLTKRVREKAELLDYEYNHSDPGNLGNHDEFIGSVSRHLVHSMQKIFSEELKESLRNRSTQEILQDQYERNNE